MGALVPNRGSVRTLGADPAAMPPEVRARVGYLADEMEVPGWMSLHGAMELQATYFPAWDGDFARDLMRRFELQGTMVYRALSKGQRRRFLLALLVATRPDLLVLDEPAGGLDVGVRRQFFDLLMEQAAERRVTIVISSHILSDVERIVDRVAFLKGGRLVRAGQLDDLKASVKRLVLPGASEADETLLRQRFSVLSAHREEGALLAVVDDFDPERLTGLEATVEHLNLEELYLVFNTLAPEAVR